MQQFSWNVASDMGTLSRSQAKKLTLAKILFATQLFFPLIVFKNPGLGNFCWVALSTACFLFSAWLLLEKLTRQQIAIAQIFLLLSALSFASVVFAGPVDVRSLSEVIRPLVFFSALILGLTIGSNATLSAGFMAFVARLLMVYGVMYVVLSILFRNTVDDYELLYGKIDNVVSFRLFAPFANPYDMALAYTLPVLYFLITRNNFFALTCLVTLIFTQSRTGIILCTFATVALLFSGRKLNTRLLRYVLLFFAVMVISVIQFDLLGYFSKYYLISNTLGLIDGSSTSLDKRFAQYDELGAISLLGEGALGNATLIIENGFIFEMVKNGVISIATISIYYVFPAVLAALIYLKKQRPPAYEAAAIWVAACIIGSMSNVFIYPPKISSLYWIFVGFLLGYLQIKKTTSAPIRANSQGRSV